MSKHRLDLDEEEADLLSEIYTMDCPLTDTKIIDLFEKQKLKVDKLIHNKSPNGTQFYLYLDPQF